MKHLLLTILTSILVASTARPDHEPPHRALVLKNKDGVAILGHDPVAYFTDNKPVKGTPKFQSEYEGARYYFGSQKHKALFDANPAKYAPAYGGYCGYAASLDRLATISPESFQIVDGRLILQHNKKAYDKFNADLKGNVTKADRIWPGLVERETARRAASSRFPLTWPGLNNQTSLSNPPPQKHRAGSVATQATVSERQPMPGDIDWPGF